MSYVYRKNLLRLACVTGSMVGVFTACGSNPAAPTAPATSSTSAERLVTQTPVQQPTYSVTSFVSTIAASDGSQVVQRSGAAPSPNGGPSSTLTSNNSVINGGSSLVRVQSAAAFQAVYVFIGGIAGSVGGYWEVRMPASATSVTLTVSLNRSIPVTAFDLVYAVVAASGAVGPYNATQTRVLAAATGEVQVSASWDALSDVDLHVIDPAGEEIFYGNPTSRSGGALDLDSNPACAIDRKNNENTRWVAGRAPLGSYRVRLDYYDSCGVAQTNYVVTLNNGGTTQTFRGSFTGTGDQGEAGSGRAITTFTHGSSLIDPGEIHELSPTASRPPALFSPSPLKIRNLLSKP
jgi:uncharacterized protein YfaP (DUF2135 family)